MRRILHVDMDAFFAAVEQRDDPTLRGRPVLVGGASRRGVVASASYEARPFGVRSAMPMTEALRRCPEAVVVTAGRGKYLEASNQIFEVFRSFSPLVEGLSIDEAFLDLTGTERLLGPPAEVAERVRAEILKKTQLTASGGLATSKFVAKIASDENKPDGLCVVEPGTEASFLAPLPIRRMWGVGPKAAKRLEERGYRTLGDLVRTDLSVLEALLGSHAARMQALAQGCDDRAVQPGREPKSLGTEQTFERDRYRTDELEGYLLSHASETARRLVRSELAARVVRVKLKYADFSLQTRQMRLPHEIADTDSIFEAARELLQRFSNLERGVRLIGLAVAELSPLNAQQTELAFTEPDQRRRKLEQAIVDVETRLGKGKITRARLMTNERNEDQRAATSQRRHGLD